MCSHWRHVFIKMSIVIHQLVPAIVLYYFMYKTQSNYVLIHSGLKTRLGILPRFAVYEASDESCAL